jgi:MFS family permease
MDSENNRKDIKKPSAIYYGWFIVATSFFISFLTVGTRNGFGVFVIPMSKDFGWDRGTISLPASIGFYVAGICQPFAGRLYDRFGARKMMLLGLLGISISTLSLSFTPNILFIIIMFGVVGAMASSGGSLNIAIALTSKWFRKKRSTAIGLIAAGPPMGAMLLIPLSQQLIHFFGWEITWIVLGLLILLLAVPLTYLIIREPPVDLGLMEDGQDATKTTLAPYTQDISLAQNDWKQALKSPLLWQLSGAYFVCGFTTGIISTHFVPYAIEKGYSPSLAATVFGVMSGLNVLGVLTAGKLGDRFQRKNLLAVIYGLRGLGYACLLILPGLLGLWGFAILAGFSWIATVPPTTALTADVYGLKNIGILSGVIFMLHQFGGGLSIQMAGELRDITGSYDVPFLISAILLVIASFVSFSIQERKYSSRYLIDPDPILQKG